MLVASIATRSEMFVASIATKDSNAYSLLPFGLFHHSHHIVAAIDMQDLPADAARQWAEQEEGRVSDLIRFHRHEQLARLRAKFGLKRRAVAG